MGSRVNNAFYCRRFASLGHFIRKLGVVSLSFSVSLIRFPRTESYKQFLTRGVAGGGGRVNTARRLGAGSTCADCVRGGEGALSLFFSPWDFASMKCAPFSHDTP